MAEVNPKSDNKVRPFAAFRAVRRVVNDPEQTTQVFRVIQALSAPSLRRNFKRFRKTEVGTKVLSEQINLVDKLTDAEYLKSLPENTLGHAYYRFTSNEQISADGLQAASEEAGYQIDDENLDRFAKRLRSSHDLFHVLTQYGRDPLGEACLLAFSYGQTGNISFPFILLMASLRLYKGAGITVFAALWRGYRDGKRAKWLPAADWEVLLTQPLEQVRDEFVIPEPRRYQHLFAQLATAT
ncbi:MAG: ubiquinone biosynthesis protein [Gammaproteobacteria bacterium]|nr:ubiquinone biosynthesis protein [Gammaproteobacteria bacterium]